MTNIDWKKINADNVETLRPTPWEYVTALVQLGLWDKLIAAFYEDSLSDFTLNALLKPKTRKLLLKDMSENKIIHLLDTVKPPFRRHLLNILIEQSDSCPNSTKVGKIVLNENEKHLWVYDNSREVLSLQPIEDLKVAFKARIKPDHRKNPIQFFKLALNPEKSYDHKKDYLKPDYVYLNVSDLADIQYLSKRKSVTILITDLLVEALAGYAKKKRRYLTFVFSPFLHSFFNLERVWKGEKSLATQVVAKVREALLKFPFHLTKKSNFQSLFQGQCLSYFFRLNDFLNSKVITIDDVFKTILPNAIQKDLELPLRKTRFVQYIIPDMFQTTNYIENNFFRVLQSISETQPEHPLAFMYPKFVSLLEEYFFKEFQEGRYYFLQFLVKKLQIPRYQSAFNIDSETLHFSYDFVIEFITKLVKVTIEQKAEIVKENPELYTNHMTAIFEALLLHSNWKDQYELWSNTTLPFFLLPAELRDQIIAEVMCDPTGQKMLSNALSKEVTTTSLSIALLFDDFKKMVKAIASNKYASTDEFGFQDKVQFNFQPSLTQKSRQAEEFNGKVHIFERFLFPMLRHKNIQIVRKAYALYISFTNKILSTSICLNNDKLYELALGVHARLCRFLNSKVNANIQDFVINAYCDQIVSPQSLFVGMKVDKKYAENLYAKLIKFPYTTDTVQMPLISILRQLLRYSYSESLPGIGQVAAKITTKLLESIYNGLPASFTVPQLRSIYNAKRYDALAMPATDAYIKSVKDLKNAQANLRLPEKLVRKLYNKYLTRELHKLDLRTIRNVSIDPALVTPELVKSFDQVRIGSAPEPFIATIDFLSKKIAQYDPKDFKRPSTSLIKILIEMLRELAFPNRISYDRRLPVVPFDYEKTNTEASYQANVTKWLTQTFKLNHATASIASCIIPETEFLYRLFAVKNLNFTQIDEVLVFVPMTPEQADQEKKNPSKKKHVSTEIIITPIPDPSVVLRLQTNDQKPKPKAPACTRCGHRENKKEKKPAKPTHEEWIDTMSWELMRPLLKADAKVLCEAAKNDGDFLFPIIKFIYISMKKNSRCEENLNFIAYLLDLCFKDILIEDPEPTEENRNPKPMPTLFMDSEGTIKCELPPFVKKDKKPTNRRGMKQRRPAPVTVSNEKPGKKQYQPTKVLISYLCSILAFETAKGKVDVSIFAKSLTDLLSIPPADLKKKIGDDNYSFYADHLSAALLNHINFGTKLKDPMWAQKFESPLIEPFFRLFTCDSVHHHSLEYVNQLLLQTSSFDERRTIITAFISFLTVYPTWNFTMHTRTRLVAWSLDYRYVGAPIPKFTFDFLNSIVEDKKLHLDVRRSIASNAVAYFKWRALNDAGAEQFDELFEILKIIYNGAKTNMAPTFCQLVRPKYCEGLCNQSQVYRAFMPKTSLPTSFVTPMNFGPNVRLSMPHTGAWEEPHRKFVSTFIGGSLLSKDENVIQLAIQVLTKLKIRGGETAAKIAPFIEDAFKQFNVQLPSAILVNFMYNFVMQTPHAEFKGLVDGFVSIFAKTREALDTINQQQMKLFWTRDSNFRINAYEPLTKICNIFSSCIENHIEQITEKDDYKLSQVIARKVVAALKGDKEVEVYFDPFNSLINNWQILTNDHLINALAAPAPCEEALNELLLFIRESANTTCIRDSFPSYVSSAINKNKNFISLKILRENLCNWPVEIAQDPNVKNLIQPLFYELLIKVGKDNEEFIAFLPQLWQFAYLIVNEPIAHCSTTANYDYYAAPNMPSLATRFDRKMMFSNCMMKQCAAPKAAAALGINRADALDEEAVAEADDDMAEGCGLMSLF